MLSYQDMPTELLIELLVKETQKIIRLYNLPHRTAEYDECLRGIEEIQEIIMSRNTTNKMLQTPTDTIH